MHVEYNNNNNNEQSLPILLIFTYFHFIISFLSVSLFLSLSSSGICQKNKNHEKKSGAAFQRFRNVVIFVYMFIECWLLSSLCLFFGSFLFLLFFVTKFFSLPCGERNGNNFCVLSLLASHKNILVKIAQPTANWNICYALHTESIRRISWNMVTSGWILVEKKTTSAA